MNIIKTLALAAVIAMLAACNKPATEEAAVEAPAAEAAIEAAEPGRTVALECADVANFAMMIAHNAVNHGPK